MKTVNISYIHYLYYPLISMTDDELSAFQINENKDRATLFRLMRLTLEKFGPKTKSNISDCLEYIISTCNHEKYWRQLVPHEVPLDEVKNKPEYLDLLYRSLFDRAPTPCKNEVIISEGIPLEGLTTKD
ncbi:hypothetical protein ACVW05_004473 [Pseudomonas fulva]